MVAGLAHDINHRTYLFDTAGTNNSFEIKNKSALAQRYNNQSVL